MKYQIFISYREERENVQFAKVVYDTLLEEKYSVFLDDKNLKSGKFDEIILSALNECQDFILLLTPGSLIKKKEDDWVYKEISVALKNRKNIIPIALYDLNEFPEDLNEEIAGLKTCHIIKLIGNEHFWMDLREGISVKPHLFVIKNKVASDGNPLIKRFMQALWIGGILWIIEFVLACLLHYMFKESWKLPFVLWNICKSFQGISIFQIIELQLLQGIVALVLFYWPIKNNILYIWKTDALYNIDIKDLDAPPNYIYERLNNKYASKRLKNKKEYFGRDDNGEWNYFEENDGLVLASLGEQYTTYMQINCRKWPKIRICGVGSMITRRLAIEILELQHIKYVRNQNNVLRFEKNDIDINIWYGKIWPKNIEIKRKNVQSALDEYIFLQNFTYEDENRVKYDCIFLRQLQYNEQIYAVLQLSLKGKKVNQCVILRREAENNYVLANQDEAEKVFTVFARSW